MTEYRVETVLKEDQRLVLDGLPFRAGDAVQVIIVERPTPPTDSNRYPLRGIPIHYEHPTEPVAEEDWEALR
jgi:hypothetical protein